MNQHVLIPNTTTAWEYSHELDGQMAEATTDRQSGLTVIIRTHSNGTS